MNRRNFVAGSTALAAVALLPQEQVKAEFTVKYVNVKSNSPVPPHNHIMYPPEELKKGDLIKIDWNEDSFHAIITETGPEHISYVRVNYVGAINVHDFLYRENIETLVVSPPWKKLRVVAHYLEKLKFI